jgi:hypothetical protein
MEKAKEVLVSEELLTQWAESCLHMNHLGTLVQRELKPTLENARALGLAERARKRLDIFRPDHRQVDARKVQPVPSSLYGSSLPCATVTFAASPICTVRL